MLNNYYCSACSTELVSTSYELYSDEAYYICPSCSAEYTVTEARDNIIVIQADLKKHFSE